MAVLIAVLATLCLVASAAPPEQRRLYTQSSGQLQQINPLDYYLDNPDVAYYSQGQQKQADASGESSARLETLEPDSEVELIPGAQPPQQPPQQNPVAPNVPGILPGQRVFIVHMPVPGYRPGTIGGYQPVYIVAAAPDGNVYAPNGFQSPAGQTVYSPFVGYNQPGLVAGSPSYLVGAAPLSRPYGLVYQEPVAYQPAAPAQAVRLGPAGAARGQHVQLTSDDRPANAPTEPETQKARLVSKEGERPAAPQRTKP